MENRTEQSTDLVSKQFISPHDAHFTASVQLLINAYINSKYS